MTVPLDPSPASTHTVTSDGHPFCPDGFVAPKSVTEFLYLYPKMIPGYVSCRDPNASDVEHAELILTLESYLRSPSPLTDCPDRIAMFALLPPSQASASRFFSFVWGTLNSSRVIPCRTL